MTFPRKVDRAPGRGDVITGRFLEQLRDGVIDPLQDVGGDYLEETEVPGDADASRAPAQTVESTEQGVGIGETWREISRVEATRRVYQNNDETSTNYVDVAEPTSVTFRRSTDGVVVQLVLSP